MAALPRNRGGAIAMPKVIFQTPDTMGAQYRAYSGQLRRSIHVQEDNRFHDYHTYATQR